MKNQIYSPAEREAFRAIRCERMKAILTAYGWKKVDREYTQPYTETWQKLKWAFREDPRITAVDSLVLTVFHDDCGYVDVLARLDESVNTFCRVEGMSSFEALFLFTGIAPLSETNKGRMAMLTLNNWATAKPNKKTSLTVIDVHGASYSGEWLNPGWDGPIIDAIESSNLIEGEIAYWHELLSEKDFTPDFNSGRSYE